jgi:hypothetical protein
MKTIQFKEFKQLKFKCEFCNFKTNNTHVFESHLNKHKIFRRSN